MVSAVPEYSWLRRGAYVLPDWVIRSLVFFGRFVLNLRVDSCMFETRFLMLAEGSTLEILSCFFWNHFE
jgi:hypothetical protein